MQGRNEDKDVENGLMDTVGEGESGTNGERSISIYTLSSVSWTGVTSCCAAQGAHLVLCDDVEGWDDGGERH